MSVRRRKHSLLHYAFDVPRQILAHPDPPALKARRLMAAVIYQLRKRMGRPPDVIEVEGIQVRGVHDAGGVANLVYFGRRFEYDEILFIERYLQPGDAVVDGGANIGLFSLVAADVVGNSGTVRAYEPSSATFERLEENVLLNDATHITVRKAALGEKRTTMSFTMGWDVSNGLVSDTADVGPVETVNVVSLDEELGDSSVYALIKLDLEGGELGALRGASKLLAERRAAVLLIEAFDHQMKRVGDSRQELLDELRDHGYLFFDYDAEGGLVTADPPPDGNFLAIQDDAVLGVRERLAA